MQSVIEDYLTQLQEELSTGNALEHSYRPALKQLFQTINPEVTAVNEPSKSKFGSPDFAFYKKKNTSLQIGYVEAKDIYVNLDEVEKSEQIKRYLGYSNLILTNYIEFRFFRNGEKYQTIEIATKEGNYLLYDDSNFSQLVREIQAFLEGQPENITNANRLAKIMGGKAARIRDNVQIYLDNTTDERNDELLRLFKIMQDLLVHDLSFDKFADMYAQTLVYGLFVARYYDRSTSNFSRQEARDLVPASNPFLRHFFDHIVGPNFDKRLGYIVDELCEVFTVSDVKEIIRIHYNLFGETVDKDPIIHFYEDFLKEYDPVLRKKMGAYYTPVPVVNFIVRAVDDILKKEFKLPDGLASTEKIEKKTKTQGTKATELFHRVQILDPAVGTATFLNEIIKYINKKFQGQEGLWPSFVEKELIPRLHGFELMMAPYTIAHLKLAMTLKETGVEKFHKRLGVYLTNTLEEGVKEDEGLFSSLGLAQAISDEGKAASEIKHKTPIMVVIGNPPYSVSSNNKSEHILKLIEDYKKDLNEKKINLDDDYIKFIRFAEDLIEKNGEGIVAMITNNSFIDGITHRQMRKHLIQTFDSIYILDLHGSTKKKETTPEGGKDENVFNIQQGVSINIFVKKGGKKKTFGKVFHAELYGKRLSKFEILNRNKLESISWKELPYSEPYYFFVPKDFNLIHQYNSFIKINELFNLGGAGIKTERDAITIHLGKNDLYSVLKDFSELTIPQIRLKYSLTKDSRDWTVKRAKNEIENYLGDYEKNIIEIDYRPFDQRYTFYTGKAKHFIGTPGFKVAQNFLHRNNLGLLVKRQNKQEFSYIFLVNKVAESCMFESAYANNNVYPLYQYYEGDIKTSNLKIELVSQLLEGLKLKAGNKIVFLKYRNECIELDPNTTHSYKTKENVYPIDILDYIYAVLHSPNYRKKYKEFLKIDFPRIPKPKNGAQFWELVKLGGKLRRLHLLEDPEITNFETTFSIAGSNIVEQVKYNVEKVFINETQYFGNVPKETWEFYIGGYQPAQKWLKDRKGRKLEYEDINHYQKIIVAMNKTQEIMFKIDEVMKL